MTLRTLADGREVFLLPEAWSDSLSIAVIGCGGTGSEMVAALMQLHHVLLAFGHPTGLRLELWDGDTVSPANVGRQRFLPTDVGRNKAEVLAQRYGALYSAPVVAMARHCARDRFSQVAHCHLVITCVDKAAFRVEFGDFGLTRKGSGPLWLDLGNGSHTGQAVLGHLHKGFGNDTLPNVLSLYPELRQVVDGDEPSCSLEAALTQQRLGINKLLVDAAIYSVLSPLLTQGWTDVHGCQVDLAKATMRPLKIGAEAWEFLGYRRPARREKAA
jgi:PRTRC genetic system ThiF family protein